MFDAPYEAGPVDHARVDLTEPNDFSYWTHRFACSPQQLIDALRAAGVEAAAVARYLAVVRAVESDATGG